MKKGAVEAAPHLITPHGYNVQETPPPGSRKGLGASDVDFLHLETSHKLL